MTGAQCTRRATRWALALSGQRPHGLRAKATATQDLRGISGRSVSIVATHRGLVGGAERAGTSSAVGRR
jgi:hypothetical protein